MAERSLTRRGEWWPGRRLAEWFDWLEWPREAEHLLRVEEKQEDDTWVIRAEMPGIDPDKDVEINMQDQVLHIRAERREEQTSEDQGIHRSEFRYGSFYRAVPLPADAKEGDVHASYKDGILEIRVPRAPAAVPTPTRIPIART